MSTLKPGAPKIEKHPISGILHVYNIDWDDNGILREVAVVKELSDGTIRGILVDQLHAIDRKRLQRFITSQHADKYELWELLANGKLSNGMNALDFFHYNYIKEKRPRGAIMGGGISMLSTSIDAARIPVDTGEMIGARSTDPTAAQVAAPGEY